MRVLRIHGWGEGTMHRAGGGATFETEPLEDRRLYVITDGEATIGHENAAVARGYAIEVDVGEALNLRPTTETVTVYTVMFSASADTGMA